MIKTRTLQQLRTGWFPLFIKYFILLFLFIKGCYSFGNSFKTLSYLVKCPLFSQFDVLLHLFEFLFDFSDEAVLMSCYFSNYRFSEITTFELTIEYLFTFHSLSKLLNILSYSSSYLFNRPELMIAMNTKESTMRTNFDFISKTINLQILLMKVATFTLLFWDLINIEVSTFTFL